MAFFLYFYFTLSSFSKTLDSREFSIIRDAFHRPANNISGWRIGFGILISTDSIIPTVWNSKYILTDIFDEFVCNLRCFSAKPNDFLVENWI